MTKNTLKLIKPLPQYAEQVMAYKEEMLSEPRQDRTPLHGCAGLEECSSFGEWVDFDKRPGAKYDAEYVPSEVFLAIWEDDDKLIGMIDFRHPLTPAMLENEVADTIGLTQSGIVQRYWIELQE